MPINIVIANPLRRDTTGNSVPLSLTRKASSPYTHQMHPAPAPLWYLKHWYQQSGKGSHGGNATGMSTRAHAPARGPAAALRPAFAQHRGNTVSCGSNSFVFQSHANPVKTKPSLFAADSFHFSVNFSIFRWAPIPNDFEGRSRTTDTFREHRKKSAQIIGDE